jgi:hypothetical protein
LTGEPQRFPIWAALRQDLDPAAQSAKRRDKLSGVSVDGFGILGARNIITGVDHCVVVLGEYSEQSSPAASIDVL